jgi:hypothetical protein
MKTILLTAFVVGALTGYAQGDVKVNQPGRSQSDRTEKNALLRVVAKPDTLLPESRNLQRNRIPKNGMPNVFTVKPLPPVYKGNNGQGFDIYESRVDGMPTLVPDSSFVNTMPNTIQKMYLKQDSVKAVPVNPYPKRRYPNR